MLLNSFLQNILNKTNQIFQRPEKQTNSTNEMYWLLLLLRNPHLPIPYTFGTRGLVTWHIENLKLASKYIGNWKIWGCKRRFLTIYSMYSHLSLPSPWMSFCPKIWLTMKSMFLQAHQSTQDTTMGKNASRWNSVWKSETPTPSTDKLSRK